jgi:hypothetical protein
VSVRRKNGEVSTERRRFKYLISCIGGRMKLSLQFRSLTVAAVACMRPVRELVPAERKSNLSKLEGHFIYSTVLYAYASEDRETLIKWD